MKTKNVNDLEYVIHLLNDDDNGFLFKEINSNTYVVLNRLARYYYYNHDKKKTEIIHLLSELMQKNYRNYNINSWYKIIEKQAVNAKKQPLNTSKDIRITRKEMDYINNLNGLNCKKILFTILCYSKYYNLLNENNNGWCNVKEQELFRAANVKCSKKDKGNIIYKLVTNGSIKLSNRHDNSNICALMLDEFNQNNYILNVNQLHDLGYQYLSFIGKKYKECSACGNYFKYNVNQSKYCNDCAGYKCVESKIVKCIDCGNQFESHSKASKKQRCDDCQKEYVKAYDRLRKASKTGSPY